MNSLADMRGNGANLFANLCNMPGEVAVDMVKFVNSLRGIPRRGRVKYREKSGRAVDFNYCLLDDILDKVKASEKFCFMFNGSFCDSSNDSEGELSGILLHISGFAIEGPHWYVSLANDINSPDGKRSLSSMTPQEKESKRSYAKRYYLSTWFAIATDDDLDGMDEKASVQPVVAQTPSVSVKNTVETETKGAAAEALTESIESKTKRAASMSSLTMNKLLGECSPEELLKITSDREESPKIRSAARFLVSR